MFNRFVIFFTVSMTAMFGHAGDFPPEPVVWTELENTTANGSTVTKNGVNSWNGGAWSELGIDAAGGYVETIITSNSQYRMFGLGTTNSSSSYTDLDFGVYLQSGGTLYVFENGSNKGTYGTYAIGDTLRIEVVGTAVQYKINGQTRYTSATILGADSFPLHADICIHSAYASFADVVMSRAGNDPLNVSIFPLIARGEEGGAFSFLPGNDGVLNLTNTSENPLDWTAAAMSEWLQVDPRSGTLAPGESKDVSVHFSDVSTNLPWRENDYAGIVQFVNVDTGKKVKRTVSLTVSQKAPTSLISNEKVTIVVASGGQSSEALNITNVSSPEYAPVRWTIEAQTDQSFGDETTISGLPSYNWSGGTRYRGNRYQVNTSTTLKTIGSWNTFSSQESFHYVVFESQVSNGTFTKIAEQTVTHQGQGAGFYSSDPFNIQLESGKYYILATGWTGSIGYSGSGGSANAVAFGTREYGFWLNSYPAPETLTPSNTSTIYHQKIETSDGWLTPAPTAGETASGASSEVTITANASGMVDGVYGGEITVVSNDAGSPERKIPVRMVVGNTVYVTLPLEIKENAWGGSGVVSIPATATEDVFVSLTPSQVDRLNLPATVRIPAGEVSASFTFGGINNDVNDGNHEVRVTASAAGFVSGYDDLIVRDDDLHHFEVSLPTGPHFADQLMVVSIAAMTASDEIATAFTGTVDLSSLVPVAPAATSNFISGVWTGEISLTDRMALGTIGVSAGGFSGSSAQFRVVRRIFVDGLLGSSFNTGFTAGLPKQTIQSAIDATVDGDHVIVQQGTYSEHLNPWGKSITISSSNPEVDSVVAATILDCSGLPTGDPMVLFNSGEGEGTSLLGFTLSGANPMNSSFNALRCDGSSPLIKRCVFTGNNGFAGASVITGDGVPNFVRCSFLDSTTGYFPVAIQSPVRFSDCVFSGNSGTSAGAVVVSSASAQFYRCRFENNIASAGGGAVEVWEGSRESRPVFRNCLFYGNQGYNGGAISVTGGAVDMAHCTFYANYATSTGGAVSATAPGTTAIVNSILWDNYAATSPQATSGVVVSYSCVGGIGGSLAGTGNFNQDPLFVNRLLGDLHLDPLSPCINTGTLGIELFTDFDGEPRPFPRSIGLPDMGYDEYVKYYTITVSDISGTATPAAGTYSFAEGEYVRLSAGSNPVTAGQPYGQRYAPMGWAGSGSVPGAGSEQVTPWFAVSGDSTITWNWETQYELQLFQTGNGSLGGDPAGWYAAGSSVSIQATPADGEVFEMWSGHVTYPAANPALTIVIDQWHELTANFTSYTGGPRSAPQSFYKGMNKDWNFVSIPFPLDGSDDADIVFNSHNRSTLYKFTGRRWSREYFVQPYVGYYVNMLRDVTVKFDGYPEANPERTWSRGWNVVGVAGVREQSDIPNLSTTYRVDSRGRMIRYDGPLLPGEAYYLYMTVDTLVDLGDGMADFDSDGLSDLEEKGTDPTNPDTDGDFVADGIEADEDDAFEMNATATADVNNNGVPDDWELHIYGFTAMAHADLDYDGDGLTNAEEFAGNNSSTWTNPGLFDSDGDTLSDKIERDNGLNPLFASDYDSDGLFDDWERLYFNGSLTPNGAGDYDQDGLSNLDETIANTNPNDPDSDGDGIGDGWEVSHNLDPLAPNAIQEAVTAALDGETLVIHPGTYRVDALDFAGKAMTLQSTAPSDPTVVAATILQGDKGTTDLHPVIRFHTNETTATKLYGLSIIDGGQSGIVCVGASPSILNCEIRNNAASDNGAGIRVTTASRPTIRGCRISDNTTTAGTGGGIYLDGGAPIVEHCVIVNNTASGNGGGLYLSNTTVSLRQLTIADNSSSTVGGGAYLGTNTTVSVRNSIVWGNTATASGSQFALDATATLDIDYSDVQDSQPVGAVTWGAGIFSTDPEFAGAGDYHLKSSAGRYLPTGFVLDPGVDSPALDAADPATNLIAETRPHGYRVNLGAYGNTEQASRTKTQPEIELVPNVTAISVLEGGAATIGVRLTEPPTTSLEVTINLTQGANGAQILLTTTGPLTFTNDNWHLPQLVSVEVGPGSDQLNGAATLAFQVSGATDIYLTINEIDKDLSTNAPVVIGGWPQNGAPVAVDGDSLLVTYLFSQAATTVDVAAIILRDDNNTDVTGLARITSTAIEWRIDNPTSGLHMYTLELVDTSSNTSITELSFFVDAEAPEVTASKSAGRYAAAFNDLTLTASEPATIYYTTNGDPPILGSPTTLSGTSPVENLSIDKTTKLQFFAVDTAGNQSETQTVIYRFVTDNFVMATGLSAYHDPAANAVQLSWKGTADDTVNYHIYRASGTIDAAILQASYAAAVPPPSRLRIGSLNDPAATAVDPMFHHMDADIVSGDYFYAVTLVHPNGLEGPASLPAALNVSAANPAESTEEAVTRGIQWLLANQNPNGSWGDTDRERLRTTIPATRALQLAGENKSPVAHLSLFYILGQSARNNQDLANQIILLNGWREEGELGIRPVDLFIRLLARGYGSWNSASPPVFEIESWGLRNTTYSRDPVSTALCAMAYASSDWANLSTTNRWYDHTADIDSSITNRYGWQSDGPPNVFASALAYASIIASAAKNDETPGSVLVDSSWIYDDQASGPDPSFGTELLHSAAALIWLDTLSSAQAQPAVDLLLQRQQRDGSWNTDPILTAFCLQALIRKGAGQ